MVRKKILTIVAVVLFAGSELYAGPVDKIFTSSGQILPGEQWNMVSIYDTLPNHTTVDMTGGIVNEIACFDASALNVLAGQIGSNLTASEQSTINIYGGSLDHMSSYDISTINLSGNSTVYSISALRTSIFNMYGGTTTYLGAVDSSVLNLHGGAIINYLNVIDSSMVNVFGYNLVKTSTGGTYGYGQVTGFWQNDLPFTINLAGSGTYSRVNLIPEPSTIFLLSLGIFCIRKRN